MLSVRSDGELDADRAARLDTHLASCERCRAFDDRLEQLKSRLAGWTVAPLPADAAGVLRRIPIAVRRPNKLRAVAIGVAAAAVVIGVLVGSAFNGFEAPRTRAIQDASLVTASEMVDPFSNDSLESAMLAMLPENGD